LRTVKDKEGAQNKCQRVSLNGVVVPENTMCYSVRHGSHL
jgi:hypothetical protein